MSGMLTRIQVSYDGSQPGGELSFELFGTEGKVTCSEDGTLAVPPGDHVIRFERSTRIEPAEWSFSGFRYKPSSSTESFGPISSIEIGDDYVEIIDLNHSSGSTETYFYEFRILEPGGGSKWIDPVIENKPGDPPPDSE